MHFILSLLALCLFALATATPLLPSHRPDSLSNSPSVDEHQLLRLHHFGTPGQTTSTPPRNGVIKARDSLEARDGLQLQGKLGGMYMCTGPNFTGTCKYIRPAMNTCYGLFPGFKSNISSFSPDQVLRGSIPQFAFGCRLYEGESCNAANVRFEYPGISAGRLWVDPKSAKCEFYDPAAAKWYELWGDRSTYGK